MINAHCEQSKVYWVQDEKKLYNFRILELSEPFCDGRKEETVLSRSCDNVTQKLKQERYKRVSETFTCQSRLRAPNRRQRICNRAQSLPLDLSECGRDYFPADNYRKSQGTINNTDKHSRECYSKRKINGLSKGSFDNEIHSEVTIKVTKDDSDKQKNTVDEHDSGLLRDCSRQKTKKTDTKQSVEIDDVLTDDHFTQIKSNLNELSNRFDKKQLEEKSKEELVSIILELQDALRLATDD